MGVIIIGGGIVGLATALQLTRRYQGLPVTVIEKEEDVLPTRPGKIAASSMPASTMPPAA
ncbi:MAG TPA: FAD-dependent oxidoreductase [Candidatus Acidoferrum sp.]|nr:FAD-dependent oxidoreductase [Candidatus Acidoferrum sp.]